MTYNADELREASERVGLPFGYLQRLAAAEGHDPQDPDGSNTLARQLTVVFDHYVAKCLADPDPIGALRQFGFTETAEAFASAQRGAGLLDSDDSALRFKMVSGQRSILRLPNGKEASINVGPDTGGGVTFQGSGVPPV